MSSTRDWRKAKQYFIDIGEWQKFEKPVMHHIDESLRHNDIERYNQWNPEDLVVMELSDHIKFHNSGENNPMYGVRRYGEDNPCFGRKHSDEELKKMKANHYDCSGENNPMYGRTHYKCIETSDIIKSRDELRRFLNNPKALLNHVSRCAKGKRNIAYGYHWEIIEEDE